MISGPGRILRSPNSSPCGLGVSYLLRSFERFVLPMDRTRLAAGSSGSWSMNRLWRLAERCRCASSEPGAVVGGRELCGGVVVVNWASLAAWANAAWRAMSSCCRLSHGMAAGTSGKTKSGTVCVGGACLAYSSFCRRLDTRCWWCASDSAWACCNHLTSA